MNKIVVGAAPSPNLMSAQSRIGSLSNTKHRVRQRDSQAAGRATTKCLFSAGGRKCQDREQKVGLEHSGQDQGYQ